ncbi:unnamed protein product, partial [Prunus brigantina]
MLKNDGNTESSIVIVSKAHAASFSFPRPTLEEKENMHCTYYTCWIIDSGATDNMTYDKSFFHSMTAPTKTSVGTANGESNSLIGAGSITLTYTLSLYKTLVVLTLMFRLGRSLGMVLREWGLYYVDDIASGCVYQIRGVVSEKQIWLW